MIRSKHHTKQPMNHTIRIRITRRRWLPEGIEAGDANDPGECWDELFGDEDEADAYLWRYLCCSLDDVREATRGVGWYSYSDADSCSELIRNGGTIEWSATLIDCVPSWHIAPPPFNPDYNPKAAGNLERVAESMERDGYYDRHTREECAREIARRLADLN